MFDAKCQVVEQKVMLRYNKASHAWFIVSLFHKSPTRALFFVTRKAKRLYEFDWSLCCIIACHIIALAGEAILVRFSQLKADFSAVVPIHI